MQKRVDRLIRQAIRRRRLLMFLYRGRIRVVEPHLYGVNTARHTVLSAWQKNQASQVSPRDCWRTYFVNHMRRVELLPIAFDEARDTYNPHRPPMTCVIDQLPPSSASSSEDPKPEPTTTDPRQLSLPLESPATPDEGPGAGSSVTDG
jgi:hypothetical protein